MLTRPNVPANGWPAGMSERAIVAVTAPKNAPKDPKNEYLKLSHGPNNVAGVPASEASVMQPRPSLPESNVKNSQSPFSSGIQPEPPSSSLMLVMLPLPSNRTQKSARSPESLPEAILPALFVTLILLCTATHRSGIGKR